MSKHACVAYYGIRFEIDPSQIEGLENRSDPRIVAAKRTGLQYYWTNFSSSEERYIMFIGFQMSILGSENKSEWSISYRDFQIAIESTKEKLKLAGFTDDPRLYLQWEEIA